MAYETLGQREFFGRELRFRRLRLVRPVQFIGIVKRMQHEGALGRPDENHMFAIMHRYLGDGIVLRLRECRQE